MAKKRIKKILKLQIPAGKANPAPPVGPALGSAGLNIMEFCQKFNEATKAQINENVKIPVEITVYEDRTYSLRFFQPPVVDLIKKALNMEKGAATAGKEKAGVLSRTQVREIAKRKLNDLNTDSLEEAEKIIEGTARSMGVEVK